MKVIQCDRCKKIINNGRLVRFQYKQFERKYKTEERDWNTIDLEVCESCFNNLLIFLGDNTSKQELAE